MLLLGILKYYTLQVEGIAIFHVPLASNLVLFSPIWFVCFIFLFSSKLFSQLFRNPCDSSISPIYYSTRKTSFGAAYSFPMINLTLSSQQDVIFHQVNREIQYFSVVLSTLTNIRRVANLRPSYSIEIFFFPHHSLGNILTSLYKSLNALE